MLPRKEKLILELRKRPVESDKAELRQLDRTSRPVL